jgi:hypothetical protein
MTGGANDFTPRLKAEWYGFAPETRKKGMMNIDNLILVLRNQIRVIICM